MPEPFIGSEAVAAGALSRYQLRRNHRPILPDVYVDTKTKAPKDAIARRELIRADEIAQTQIPVLGPDGYPMYYLDMGWEEMLLAVEYEGTQHAGQLGYDINRGDYLTRVGWTQIRVAAGHRRPGIIARVERE